MKSFHAKSKTSALRRGIVFLEYILLVTIVGIGSIVGLVAVRYALIHELEDVAHAIHHIHHHQNGNGNGNGNNNQGQNGQGGFGGNGGHGGNGNGNGGHDNGHGNNGNGNGNGNGGDDGDE